MLVCLHRHGVQLQLDLSALNSVCVCLQLLALCCVVGLGLIAVLVGFI
jgi:hypothetical protein